MPDPRKARVIRSRLDCLNLRLQGWNRTSIATACMGDADGIERYELHRLNFPPIGRRGRSRGRTRDLRHARTFGSTEHEIAYRPRGRRSGRSSPRPGKPGEGPQVLDGQMPREPKWRQPKQFWPSIDTGKPDEIEKTHVRFGEGVPEKCRIWQLADSLLYRTHGSEGRRSQQCDLLTRQAYSCDLGTQLVSSLAWKSAILIGQNA